MRQVLRKVAVVLNLDIVTLAKTEDLGAV